jgi:hypothetical protein
MDIENPSLFYSAHVRCNRAKEHLKDLGTQIDKFFRKKPYAIVTENDSDGIHQIHIIRFTERFPFRWRILATEIIEHARASLDHATFAAHLAARGHPNSNFVAFPFGRMPADLDNSVRGRSKELLPEIQTLLRSFNCYEGGNDPLYTLNELCNVSKHALIAFMAGVASAGEVQGLYDPFALAGVQFTKNLHWDRAKNEIQYARTKRDVGFNHYGNLTIFVAIQNKEATSTESAVAVLDTMVSEAQRVVSAIEAECRRLGLNG